MAATYVRSVVQTVLAEKHAVVIGRPIPLEDDMVAYIYRLGRLRCPIQYDIRLFSMEGDTLKTICEDLGVGFDTVRAEVEEAGGLLKTPEAF